MVFKKLPDEDWGAQTHVPNTRKCLIVPRKNLKAHGVANGL
jgi:hypothetical protein